MIDDKILKDILVLLKAEQRLTPDPDEHDSVRNEGTTDGMVTAIEMIINGKPWCPPCGTHPKDYETHICYPEEEATCYACGKEFPNGGGWKHAKTCKEDRY